MGMGQFPSNFTLAEKLEAISNIPNRRQKNAIKDTISLPSNGYAVIRFKASNPGFWLLHCHFGKQLKFSSLTSTVNFPPRIPLGCGDGFDCANR
jgi:hypothetical protein